MGEKRARNSGDLEALGAQDGESVRYRGGRITVECVPRAFRQFVPVAAPAVGSE